jgi:hypothetical protein
MSKMFTPDVKRLLGEFLLDADEQAGAQVQSDAIKAEWVQRDDIAAAMRPWLEATREDPDAADGWSDAALKAYPDALYWQLALFRTCARLALERIEQAENAAYVEVMRANPVFGMF